MERDIAVICAVPPGANLGMTSVDFALLLLVNDSEWADRVELLHLYEVDKSAHQAVDGLKYRVLPDDPEFLASRRLVLFWGDFFHMRQYQDTVALRLVHKGKFQTREEAAVRVRDIFLLANQPHEVLARTLTFGTTLLFNTVRDDLLTSYGPSLRRFLSGIRGAWFRDVFSAIKASLLRGDLASNCLGVDCACLIDPRTVGPPAAFVERPPKMGVFFGRTSHDAKALGDFAMELARQAGCEPTWMPWGDPGAFPYLDAISRVGPIGALVRTAGGAPHSTMEALRNVMQCRFIVTDTYHVCVNAWSLGIPAVCLIDSAEGPQRSVNAGDPMAARDKRHVFMSMYDALDFAVPVIELRDRKRRAARLSSLLDLFGSGQEIAEIHARIRAHAAWARASLLREMEAML